MRVDGCGRTVMAVWKEDDHEILELITSRIVYPR